MLPLMLTDIRSTMLESSAVDSAQTPKETPNPSILPKLPYHIQRLMQLATYSWTPIRSTKQASTAEATEIGKLVTVDASAQWGTGRVRQGQKRCGLPNRDSTSHSNAWASPPMLAPPPCHLKSKVKSRAECGTSSSPHSLTTRSNQLNLSGPMSTLPCAILAQSASSTAKDTNVTDLQQWEQMQTFHSLPTAWPPVSQSSNIMLLEESVLQWMMRQPSLDAAWRHTYAWMAQLDSQPEGHSIVTPLCPTDRIQHICHA